MGTMKKNTLSKLIAIALPVGLTLAPSVALADDNASGVASFQTQYQQNVNIENTLSGQAKSLNVTNVETLTLNYRVQVLNYQINQLYAREQSLAAAQTSSTSPTQTTRQQLIANRNQLLQQLRTLWKNTFGIGAGAGLQISDGEGNPHKGPKGHGHGPQSEERVTLNQLLHANQTNLCNWLTTIVSDFGHGVTPGHGDGHNRGDGQGQDQGHGHHRDKGNGQPVTSQNLTDAITQMTQLIAQIGQLEAQIEQTKPGDDHGQHKEQRLGAIQRQILHLQTLAIQDLTRWIILGGATPVTTDSTVAGVQLSASATTVSEDGHITYTAQLVNAANQPVSTAGVKIVFSLASNGNDGALVQSTTLTDANGRGEAEVVAGNVVGSLIVTAQIDNSTLPSSTATAVQVQSPSNTVSKLVAAGTSFPTSLSVQQNTGANVDIYPETASGTIVAGDQLRITTSNPAVLALPSPDASSSTVETLNVGNYVIPALEAKSVGMSTVTITDETAPSHPSLQYTVQVSPGTAVGLVAVNPDGSMNHSYPVNAGSDGPFQISVVNAAGAQVPAPSNIELSQAQVNAIIGAGNSVRPANANNEVQSVMILQGQSSVTVYADGVTAGVTHPTELQLSALAPSLVSGHVVSGNTVMLTFNQSLNSDLPSVGDFTVNWGSGTGTPQAVSISGNNLTLTLWGNVLQHGDNVTVNYNPVATDLNPLTGIFGLRVSTFANADLTNSL